MLSKAKVKYIKSLQIKKFRKIHGEFLVEGAKSVIEVIQSDFQISSLYVTDDFLKKYNSLLSPLQVDIVTVRQEELEDLGTFSSNNAALAIVKNKPNTPLFLEKNEFILVLDEVKDPGNMGTIIRIADWYGISKIVCSNDSAEMYNPKVISSSMGSFTRVNVYYCDLNEYFRQGVNAPVYAALLEGKDVHTISYEKKGFILMGNESDGIRTDLLKYITQKVNIPRKGKAESLNVAVATGIICDQICR